MPRRSITPLAPRVTPALLVAAGLALASPPSQAAPFEKPPGAIDLLCRGESHGFVARNGGPLNWPLEHGVLTSTSNGSDSNHAISKQTFRDFVCHVEFLLPEEGDSNSGLYLQGLYEVQILRAQPGLRLTERDLGAIYGIRAPDANAATPDHEWYSIDVRFVAPRRDAGGAISTPGELSVWVNGEQVHDNVELDEPVSRYRPLQSKAPSHLKAIWERYPETLAGPIVLQDHGAPVKFRNVWVMPLE